jgi:hypothetical protein
VASAAISEFLSGNEAPAGVHLVFFSPGDADVFLRNHKFEA